MFFSRRCVEVFDVIVGQLKERAMRLRRRLNSMPVVGYRVKTYGVSRQRELVWLSPFVHDLADRHVITNRCAGFV
jgi:hypothetical protein